MSRNSEEASFQQGFPSFPSFRVSRPTAHVAGTHGGSWDRQRRGMTVARVVAAVCFLAMFERGHGQPTIVSMTPSKGSLAGGTRMLIKGQGFSTNTGG